MNALHPNFGEPSRRSSEDVLLGTRVNNATSLGRFGEPLVDVGLDAQQIAMMSPGIVEA